MLKLKKTLKEIFTLTLCMVFMLTMIIPSQTVKAQEKSEKNQASEFAKSKIVTDLAKKYSSVPEVIDESSVFIKLSYEDNIKYIAESKNISVLEAEKLVKDKDSQKALSLDKVGSVGMYTSMPGELYEDVTGIILKEFYLVSSASTTCTVIAAINVKVRIYWEYAHTREFLQVYDSDISMKESNIWQWDDSTISTPIMENGNINLDASGTIYGTISGSLAAQYRAVGFSVGTDYFARKFHTISYIFNPDYSGAYLH